MNRSGVPKHLLERIYARLALAPGASEWTHGECWIWPGALCGGNRPQACGRPAIKWKGRVLYVTRALLADRLGRPLRAGLIVAHSCDNPRCVNPSHLTEATSSQNLREAWERGRRQRRSDTPSTFTGAVEE